MFDTPIETHEKPWWCIETHGAYPQMYHHPDVMEGAIKRAVAIGADPNHVTVVVPAAGPKSDHFKAVRPASPTTSISDRVWADGVISVAPRGAVIVPVADCTVGVAKNLTTKTSVVWHGGKPALRTWDHLAAEATGSLPVEYEPNIVERCLQKLDPEAYSGSIKVHATGAISPRQYRHEQPSSRLDREGFHRRFRSDAFAGEVEDGCLDLYGITRVSLFSSKADRDFSSGTCCTATTDGMASVRADKLADHRNIVIFVDRPY